MGLGDGRRPRSFSAFRDPRATRAGFRNLRNGSPRGEREVFFSASTPGQLLPLALILHADTVAAVNGITVTVAPRWRTYGLAQSARPTPHVSDPPRWPPAPHQHHRRDGRGHARCGSLAAFTGRWGTDACARFRNDSGTIWVAVSAYSRPRRAAASFIASMAASICWSGTPSARAAYLRIATRPTPRP